MMKQQVWKDPPLYYSLAQLIFNEIPSLEQSIPDIASSMSEMSFTDYQKMEIDSVEFSVTQGSDAKIHTTKKQQWNFFNKSNKSVFSLNTNSLVFATTEYQGRDHFTQEVMKGINVVNSVKKLDFIDRIGLRHIDLIIPPTDKSVYEYISSNLHGVKVDSTLKKTSQTTESIYSDDVHWVVCRTLFRDFPSGLIQPDSFMGLIQLNVADKFNLPSQQEVACIDMDSFVQHRIMDFDLEDIKKNLLNLRLIMDPVFKNSVSKTALEQWT